MIFIESEDTKVDTESKDMGTQLGEKGEQQQTLPGLPVTQPPQEPEAKMPMAPAVDPAPGAPVLTPPAAPAPAAKQEDRVEIPLDKLLGQILMTRRAHGSEGDTQFRLWLHAYLQKNLKLKPYLLNENIIVSVGTKVKGQRSKTLFSAHVDTVHSTAKSDGTNQRLAYDKYMGQIFLLKEFQVPGNVLGADDGAGIYLLLKMLHAKVPGTYVFHVGEERGGIGSRELAKKNPEFLKGFDRAIAFDRKDTVDVVATQHAGPCASILCANTLAAQLNMAESTFQYAISHKGSFTDTASYRDIIPECLNVSCGYENAHSPDEYLNVGHLNKLVNACIKVKWEDLPVERKPYVPPKVVAPPPPTYGGQQKPSLYPTASGRDRPRYEPMDKEPTTMDFLDSADFTEVQLWVEENPDAAARGLWQLYALYKGEKMKADILQMALDT